MSDNVNLSLFKRLLMLIFNYIPFLQLAGGLCILYYYHSDIKTMCLFLLFWIYLCPPILARLILIFSPIKNTRIKVGSREYFSWWSVFCLQIMYLRFPLLEELIRIVPGLYSNWLRLWGAKIGKLTYWAPGTCILDRPFIEIGDFVVFGAGVRINPHVIDDKELILASVKIENNVTVGGYSLLTAGATIKKNQSTKALLQMSPFSIWENNKKIRQ